MSKYTPGPWKTVEQASGAAITTDYSATWGHVATIQDMPNRWERDANARLIAAAPELYNALRAMIEHWHGDTDDEACRLTRAALAKAEGRS